MPAKSEAQRRYLRARFGDAWVEEHHFDNKGKLPARVGGRKKVRKPKRVKLPKAPKKGGGGKVVDYSTGTRLPKGHRGMKGAC